MKQFRVQLVIAFVVFLCGISLMGLIYIIFNKPYVPINPGVVVSHPSPVAAPHLPMRTSSRVRVETPAVPHIQGIRNESRIESTVSLPATGSYSLWTLSSAKISDSGSGIGSSAGYVAPASTGKHSSAQRGISTTSMSVTMPMTTFVAMASARTVAAPAASEAPQMAKMASAHNAPPPPNPGGLDEEHQLIEHLYPIGDAVLPLLILAMGWILYKRKKLAA